MGVNLVKLHCCHVVIGVTGLGLFPEGTRHLRRPPRPDLSGLTVRALALSFQNLPSDGTVRLVDPVTLRGGPMSNWG